MKKYIVGFLLAAILAAVAIWWFKFKNEPTLADLQKQYVLAKTDAEKNQVVDRLEQYYLNFAVPDTIRQRVDREVAMQLDTTKISLIAIVPDTNVYRLESQLQSMLQKATIARARDEHETFQMLIGQAKNFAQVVDAGMQNYYWVPFVDETSGFTKKKAVTWLKAKRAEWLCRFYHDTANKIIDAESYASLSLKSLYQVKDDRIKLDLIQRIQWILHLYRSMHELSIALAQKALPQAEKIKYHLRSNGLMLIQAEALSKMGQNQAALAYYDKILDNAEKFKSIEAMPWFVKRSLLSKVEVYRELGEFEKASTACREAERLQLDPTETILLQIAKFNLLSQTAHYEQAEVEIKKALALTESQRNGDNHVSCLNNLGVLYQSLTEYELALSYFRQAQAFCTDYNISASMRMSVFSNIAHLFAIKNDTVQFEKIIKEMRGLIKLTHSPYMEAQLLSEIGNSYQLAKRYRAAQEYHHRADSIYSQNGFLRLALIKKIDLLECLIALSRFSEARALVTEMAPFAKKINDIEGLINIYHRVAQISYREGNIGQAVENSNRLLYEIAAMNSRFNNPDRLIAYRQKIYDCLKYAVLYDIALQHQDMAFAKLDHAKAYTLKNRLFSGQGNNHDDEAKANYLNLDFIKTKLSAKSLLIDYMITPDTLCVFVLDHAGLQLLRKKIDPEMLRQTTSAYRDSINKTSLLFRHYDAEQVNLHYTGTVALGQKLYQALLEWPEIEARLAHAELLYIVPDEFLYEIPFSTLLVNHSEARTFLVNRTAVLTLPSTSFLANTQLANGALNQRQTKKVLISVDKRFPGTEQFVTEIKAIFPLAEELMVSDSSFTKEKVLAQLQNDYQVYIFLGHGQANTQYPDQGYIELAVKTQKETAAKKMQLTVADLKTINWLGAEMVMLVGCETAGGKLYRGTGISGLQQEFLSLGAKNVLGNLWEVDATHAITQAQDFLTKWLTIGNSARALQASQCQAVQTLLGHRYYQQPHPYFWGSTVLLTAIPQ